MWIWSMFVATWQLLSIRWKERKLAWVVKGATRRGHPEYQEMRHECRIQTKSLGFGGNAKLSLPGEVTETCYLPGLKGTECQDERVGSGVCEQTSDGTFFGSKETRAFFLCCDFSPDICSWWKQNSVWNLGAVKRSMHETDLLLVWGVWERRTSHLSVWEEHFRECSNDKGTMGPLQSGCILALVRAKMLFASKCLFISSLMWISAISFWDR